MEGLQEFVRVARYARYLPEKKRRENWDEQIARVMDMHNRFFAGHLQRNPMLQNEFEKVQAAMLDKRVLGSQRALQFGGDAILNKHARMFNCTATYLDRARSFQEVVWLLLCGCGVGVSVQKQHIACLPDIAARGKETVEFIIPDSIEGWADSIGVLLSSYFTSDQPSPKFFGKKVVFDFSEIRPKGSPISHMSGKAPGSRPLKKALGNIESVVDACIAKGFKRLRPIDAFDIITHASDAVIAGGVRRSAILTMFSLDDDEMMKSKTGNWFVENPQRGRSNNSAVLLREEVTPEQFNSIIESTRQMGEPGFIWTDDKDSLFNPCVSADTWVETTDGKKQVSDLLGTPFTAVVDGKEYSSSGFVQTGTKQTFDVVTKEGFEVKATGNHKIMTTDPKKPWKMVMELQKGDRVVVNEHLVDHPDEDSSDFSRGWIMGSLYGDGTFHYPKKAAYLCFWGKTRHHMRSIALDHLKKIGIDGIFGSEYEEKITIQSRKLFDEATKYIERGKVLTDAVEKETKNFHKGFIRGWFDADGSVQGNKKKGCSLRLTSTDLDGLKMAQRIMVSIGIMSKIYQNRRDEGDYPLPDGKGGTALFHCKAVHEVIISNSSIGSYETAVGFHEPFKAERLRGITSSYKRRVSKSKYSAVVSSITPNAMEPVYDCTVENVHAFDANGIMVHNCVEIGLYAKIEKSEEEKELVSGSQGCNLSEINMKKVTSPEDFYAACEAAAIIGTMQAAYTSFPYLGEATEAIFKREALIGVSMTGMMDCPKIAFNPEVMRRGAEVVKATNKRIAAMIGINPAARTTCVKPAGSTSCILGTASGVHPRHSQRYFRRVQANKLEEPLQYYEMINPAAVEESVWSANGTDKVITFMCEAGDEAWVKSNVGSVQLLDYVKATQQNWVIPGRNPELCVAPTMNHNVSNTITVAHDEWQTVADFIYANRAFFAGVSLLSASGDKDYNQAPFQAVHTPVELAEMYGDASVFASGLIIHALKAFDNNLYNACACFLGVGEKLEVPQLEGIHQLEGSIDGLEKTLQKYMWKKRAEKFTQRYFSTYGDDAKKIMTYCLKDVDAWKKWCDLRRLHNVVDWELFVEDEDTTKPEALAACAGGSCELKKL